jgi:hypothetical protein
MAGGGVPGAEAAVAPAGDDRLAIRGVGDPDDRCQLPEAQGAEAS